MIEAGLPPEDVHWSPSTRCWINLAPTKKLSVQDLEIKGVREVRRWRR
jgi:hypothetical protein